MYHQLQHPHELTKTLRHSVFWTHAGPAWWSLSLRDLVRNMIDGELSTRARGLARANNGGRQVASSGTSTYTESGVDQTERSRADGPEPDETWDCRRVQEVPR